MTDTELTSLIDDATFDYTMGDLDAALSKLRRATESAPSSFEAWHALAEVSLNARDLPGRSRADALDTALDAAQRADALRPDDLLIKTTLSRIWMEKGDKAAAEKYGAQARILGWKEQLQNPSPGPDAKTAGESHFTG